MLKSLLFVSLSQSDLKGCIQRSDEVKHMKAWNSFFRVCIHLGLFTSSLNEPLSGCNQVGWNKDKRKCRDGGVNPFLWELMRVSISLKCIHNQSEFEAEHCCLYGPFPVSFFLLHHHFIFFSHAGRACTSVFHLWLVHISLYLLVSLYIC